MTDEKRKHLRAFISDRDSKQAALDLPDAIIYLFSYAVNGGGFDQNTFNYRFAGAHKTLQQAMFNKILKLIHFMASDEYDTDERNEHSKKIAQELDAVINGRAMPFI